MKKYLFITMAFISLIFASCNKDDNEPETDGKGGKIRYEASISDTVNYKIRVGYINDEGDLIQEVVESPFKYEMDAKFGDYLYISVAAENRGITDSSMAKTVNCKLYIDNKLVDEQSDPDAAVIQQILGQKNL